MADYLLEIGVEELPAGYIPEAQRSLEQLMAQALKSANLEFSAIRSLSTPRRLTVIVSGLPEKQPTTKQKVKGPQESGKPEAIAGFAGKHRLSLEQLDREEFNGVVH
ncbi:MAG: glycine--tRNA ligase subunit beta, partial [Candidatus Binatia bacterium]